MAAELTKVIPQIKPAVVAIAIYNPTSAPRLQLIGSGFVVSPGNQVITNFHVIKNSLDQRKNEQYVVLSGHGNQPTVHYITQQKTDPKHDLALLTIGQKLPFLHLAAADYIPEGSNLAFTGFPITGVLGLYPATHRATLSVITPVAIPADQIKTLSSATLKQLKQPFMVYQLDGTAYPGNSGSALYQADNGMVVGVINMVLLKSTREAVLSDPSGIAFAIPVKHILELMQP